jgi:hypothetical protein
LSGNLTYEESEYTATSVVPAVRYALWALDESIGANFSLLSTDLDDTPTLEDVKEYVCRGYMALELLPWSEGEVGHCCVLRVIEGLGFDAVGVLPCQGRLHFYYLHLFHPSMALRSASGVVIGIML